MLDMTKLGFEPELPRALQEGHSPSPAASCWSTGPTGSGKTNTLYSAIACLNKPDINIMTAEDLVQFDLPGINQVQMRDSIGLSLAAALRSFLRQDANIVLVDEVVDAETSKAVVRSAARYWAPPARRDERSGCRLGGV